MDACNVLFISSPGFDYSTSQIIEGLYLLSVAGHINFKSTQANTHHGAKVQDLVPVSLEESLDSLGWADFILFSSGGDMSYFEGKLNDVLADENLTRKKVFIDGHDSDQLLLSPNSVLVYFKREMRLPRCNAYFHNNIRSLTFGIYQFLIDGLRCHSNIEDDWERRDIDVCFMAFGGSNKIRQECADALWQSDFKIEVHVSDEKQPIELERYHEILSRSKVGISVPGAGFDTLRFWETPAHGAVLAAADMSHVFLMRNAFEAHRHCLYFVSLPMMLELVQLVVLDKGRWVRMRRAMDKCLQNHSTTHRAGEVLEICQEMI